MFLILLIIVVILVAYWFCYDFISQYRKGYWKLSEDAYDEIYPKVGQTLIMDQEKLFIYQRQRAETLGKSYRSWVIGLYLFSCIRATDVEKILSNQVQIKKGRVYSFIKPFLKNGLLLSSGTHWLKRRRILTPAFHFNILQQFFVIFKEQCQNLVQILAKDSTVNVNPMAAQFTLNTICETAMGVKLTDSMENKSYRRSIHEIGEQMIYRATRPWLRNEFLYKILGYQKNFDSLMDPVDYFTNKVIKTRRDNFLDEKSGADEFCQNDENIYISKKKRYAMLDTLLTAEKNGEIDAEGVKEEVINFMFAGHDTTSIALTFILFLLAHHPEAQEKIYEEIFQVKKDNDGSEISMNDLTNMKYLDCVIKECLRIYSPVPFISRSLIEPLDMNGLTLPIGTICQIVIFDLHRDPEQFPDPEKFDPDRFLPENVANRHPFAYVPFSAGPRNCIGQKFAQLELKTVVTELISKFKLTAITKREEVVFLADMVLRTKNPIEIKFTARK